MKPRINFTYPVYPDLTQPKGALPRDKRAQACWYFYTLAQQLKEKLGESTEDQFGLLEGELWMDPHYEQIARSVATMYQLESPDEMFKFWSYVEAEALSRKLPRPAEIYKRPLRLVGIH